MSYGKVGAACMFAYILPVTIVTLRPSRGQSGDNKLPHTSVHVLVFGAFGEKIPMAQIHLRSRDGKRDLTGRDSVIEWRPVWVLHSFGLGCWRHWRARNCRKRQKYLGSDRFGLSNRRPDVARRRSLN
jgi:hypothetical protein